MKKEKYRGRPYYIYVSKLVESTDDTSNNLDYVHENSSIIQLKNLEVINTYHNKNNISDTSSKKKFENQRKYLKEFLESFYDNI